MISRREGMIKFNTLTSDDPAEKDFVISDLVDTKKNPCAFTLTPRGVNLQGHLYSTQAINKISGNITDRSTVRSRGESYRAGQSNILTASDTTFFNRRGIRT